jgi:serine/threonine protein kinase
MGDVFKARDLRREEAQDRHPFVALKVLNKEVSAHPDSFIALQREARRASMLAHPNVVTVYDFDRDGARIYMTMEYLEGRRLDTFMSAEAAKGLRVEQAWPIIRGIGLALEYGHEKRIVHSDLKPGNIFLCSDGGVKVLDFGIARLINPTEGQGEATLFDPRTRLGGLTPAYASLEMWNREPPDPRDDIYAFACVTYELLSGRHPFDRRSAKAASTKRLAPQRIEGLSRAQWEGLKKGLALRREDRTASVAQFVRPFVPRSRLRKYALPATAAAVLATAGALAVSARFYRDAVEDSTLEVLQCAQIPKPAPPIAHAEFTPTAEQQQQIDDNMALAQDFMRDVTAATPISDMKYILTDGANSVNDILDHVLKIDPTHAAALQLKVDIADLYADRARTLLEERRIEEALDLVRYGRNVLPASVELFRLEQTVCRAAAASGNG